MEGNEPDQNGQRRPVIVGYGNGRGNGGGHKGEQGVPVKEMYRARKGISYVVPFLFSSVVRRSTTFGKSTCTSSPWIPWDSFRSPQVCETYSWKTS
ncbi:MAG: hypothetical protein ABEI52_06485, partial [Halobacteriaceae archaeon]